jgi:ferredoxin
MASFLQMRKSAALVVALFCFLAAASMVSAFCPMAGQRTHTQRAAPMMFFGGNKGGSGGAKKGVSVTVSEGSKLLKEIESPEPTNLRKLLLANKVDIYKFTDKFNNCGGGGSCGTCRVRVTEGAKNCNPKSPIETKLLATKGNFGEDVRLSCCTKVSGPVSITIKP